MFGTPIRASQRIGIAIVLVALIVRGGVCFWNIDQYSSDPDAYRVIAKTLGTTRVFGLTTSEGEARPTAFRPPLYPLVLSCFLLNGEVSNVAVAALHTFLGCFTVLCTYRAARRLLGEMQHTRASILAASLVLVDPILLRQSTLVMTETLATAIASMVLWWWVRFAYHSRSVSSASVLGLLLSAAYLCRPTFLVWGGMLCLATAAAKPHHRASYAWRAGRAAFVVGALLMTVGCWTMRNAVAVGDPVWATTHGGYTLLLGNNPLFYEYLADRPADQPTWDAEPFLNAYSHRYDDDQDPTTAAFWTKDWQGEGVITVAVTEHEDDQLAYRAARATIARQPGMFAWSCIVRVYRLWTPFPHRTAERSALAVYAIGGYYTIFAIAIVIGLWRLGPEIWHPKWWPALTLIATLTLVHAVYWSNIRMRAPAIPALAIIAAAAIRQPEPEEQDS